MWLAHWGLGGRVGGGSAGVTGVARDLHDYELLAVALLRRLNATDGPRRFEAWRQLELDKRHAAECGLFDALCWVVKLDRGLGMLYEAAAVAVSHAHGALASSSPPSRVSSSSPVVGQYATHKHIVVG